MAKYQPEPRSTYHFAESYLNRQQIERVLNHYKDYISSALYILHDKDVHQVESDGGVRRQELQDQYNECAREINIIDLAIAKAFDEIGKRQFTSDEDKANFRRGEITLRKRRKSLLQKKAMTICDQIREYDKQYENQGTLKQPHYHILIKCYGAHTADAVRKWFYRFRVTEEVKKPDNGTIEIKTVNTLNRICDSVAACRDYLTHKNEPEELNKYVYDVKDVITFGQGWSAFNKAGRCVDDVLDILDRIIDDDSLRDLARDYGRDIIINYNKYSQYAYKMFVQEQHAIDVQERENDIVRHYEKLGTDNWYDILNKLNTAIYIAEKFKEINSEVNKNQ